MYQGLSVRIGGKGMTSGNQLIPQLPIVVDLTVHHRHDGPILVKDRLLSPCDVDDRQPLDSHRDAGIAPRTTLVRAAMHNRIAHRLDDLSVDRAPEIHLAHYPAHTTPARLSALEDLGVSGVPRSAAHCSATASGEWCCAT